MCVDLELVCSFSVIFFFVARTCLAKSPSSVYSSIFLLVLNQRFRRVSWADGLIRASCWRLASKQVSKGTLALLYSFVGEMLCHPCLLFYVPFVLPRSYRACAFLVGTLGSRSRHLRLHIPLRGACSPSFSRALPPPT